MMAGNATLNNMVKIVNEIPMVNGHLLTSRIGTRRMNQFFDWSGSTLARGLSNRGVTFTGSKLGFSAVFVTGSAPE